MMTESEYNILLKACRASMYLHHLILPFEQDEHDLASEVYLKIKSYDTFPDIGILMNAAYQVLVDKVSRAQHSKYQFCDVSNLRLKDESVEYDEEDAELYDTALASYLNSGTNRRRQVRSTVPTRDARLIAHKVLDICDKPKPRRKHNYHNIFFKSPTGEVFPFSTLRSRRDASGKKYSMTTLIRDGWTKVE